MHRYTPLYAAASKGRLKFVEYFAEKGAEIEGRDSDGFRPIYTGIMFIDHITR